MGERAIVSVLQSPTARAPPPGLNEDMDNKENLCSISEDGEGLPSSSKETPLPSRSRRRGRGFNLRKSLAWNQAFFTEEGVLDPGELSLLSGSVANSSRKLLSRIDGGGLSPMTRLDRSSEKSRLVFHDLEESSCSKRCAKSQAKGAKANEVLLKPEASCVVSGKDHLTRGILKSLPRSPAPSSQKRVANISTTNPTSKIPRFMPTKTHGSSVHSTSKNVMLMTKGSKSGQMTPTASVQQTAVLRVPSSGARKDFGYASAKSSAPNSCKNMVSKGTVHSKLIADPQFSTNDTNMYPTSGRQASSCTRSIPRASAPVHDRPSALRMPSRTIGFFALGKLSPSCDKNPQPADSKVPLFREAVNLKDDSDLRPQKTFTGRKPGVGIAATQSTTHCLDTSSAVSGSIISSLIPNMHLDVKAYAVKKQVDTVDRNDHVEPRSFTFETDRSERLARDLVVVGDQIDRPSQEQEIEHLSSNQIEEMPHVYSSAKRMRNEMLIEDKFTIQPQMANAAENFTYVSSPITDSRHEIPCQNSLTKMCLSADLQESNFKQQQEFDPRVDIRAKHLHVGHAIDDASAFRNEHKQSAGDTDSAFGKESAIATKNSYFSALIEDGSTLRSRTELGVDACPQVTAVSVQTTTQGNALLASESTCIPEEFQLTASEERKLHDHPTQFGLDVDAEIRSMREGAELTDNEKLGDNLKTDIIPSKKDLHAKPFSEEWLAALEAFGEEILEMKTGPVQNSPPDKALPEPGPWSPVKRKAQDIGPFDCTKYSNNSTSTTQ